MQIPMNQIEVHYLHKKNKSSNSSFSTIDFIFSVDTKSITHVRDT